LSENPTQPGENLNQLIASQTAARNLRAGGDITIETINQTIYQTTSSADIPLNISWHQASVKLLEKRLQLTTNPITTREDITYQVEQVFVPLGLLERKKVPRRKQDVSPEQGSKLFQEDREEWRSLQESELEQEVEVTQRFEYEHFLEQVLQQGQSQKSQGKRVVIIGEPGSGKTTLLQQVARWVAKTFPESIIIWISLADLSQKKLKEHVFETWLPSVVELYDRSKVSDSIKDAFIKQCNQGQVWLLLDGLDEMQVSGNPLSEMQRQIQEGGWLQQARILLTCRLNLWDGNRNSLEQFDTYRTLELAYPNQVEQFIGQWFALRGNAVLGQALCDALKEPGKARIRDLLKNPLRLTLLCFNWYLNHGHLPDTQAELYQQFVDSFYEWKQEQFPITSKQREQLNRDLAQLALAAIDGADTQQQTRFRLRQTFVSRFLNESVHGGQGTQLDLALKVGWLNKVGVDADNPTQAVYAFYHPTFEEYFAALGIDDGQFFLNPVPRNPMAKKANYRIFEPQWKQVFLLWLGRKDLKPKKEALIQTLMTFKDGCGGFYSDHAFLLAAEAIAEFKDSACADKIVNQLMQWSQIPLKNFLIIVIFGGQRFARMIWAADALTNTHIQQMVPKLVQVLETTQYKFTPNKHDGFSTIGKLNRWMPILLLGRIAPGNETAIQALMRVLKTTQDEETRVIAAQSLGSIDSGNETAIQALVRVLETTQDEKTRGRAISSLMNIIAPGNETVIRALVRVLETIQDEENRWQIIGFLGEIAPGNETAIRALVQVLETSQNESNRWRAAESLSKIAPGNETVIRALVRVLETTQDQKTRVSAAESLGSIDSGNETAIRALVRVLETTQDQKIRVSAAESLGRIDSGNETAIRALVRVLETTQDQETRVSAAQSLGRIDSGNKTAFQALVRVLETPQDEKTRVVAAASLGRIALGKELAIQALMRVLETTQDEETRRDAAVSLDLVAPGNETAIRALVRSLRGHVLAGITYGLMMKCAAVMPYRDFYQVFHSSR
jgi:HEAT repeat protein/energy-coupling factor transporter ATP-binding protein EcfA2